jgi:hypothetical protein
MNTSTSVLPTLGPNPFAPGTPFWLTHPLRTGLRIGEPQYLAAQTNNAVWLYLGLAVVVVLFIFGRKETS